jgi:chemotaxis protein MotB
MRSRRTAEAPIIIKRGKKCRCEAHGGNWKVALADFMTSMFIFCLAMWLINITTKEQKIATSDYFNLKAISAETAGSDGVLAGRSLATEGVFTSTGGPPAVINYPPSTLIEMSTEDLQALAMEENMSQEELDYLLGAREEALFQEMEQELRERINDIPELAPLAENITVEQTEQGLKITLRDLEGQPMFASGSPAPLDRTREALVQMVSVLQTMDNNIKILGHTDAVPYAGGVGGYSNWELSADRANAARRVLVNNGLNADRLIEVIGKAATEPLVPEDPTAAQNRRLELIVMAASAEQRERLMGETRPGTQPRDLSPQPADALDRFEQEDSLLQQ